MDWIRLALIAALIGGALLVSIRHSEPLQPFARALVGIVLALWVGLLMTGLAHGSNALAADGHYLMGRVIVTVSLVAVGVSMAVFLPRLRQQLVRTIARILLIGFACPACLFASFTGYLMPPDPQAKPEDYLRFRVIHMGVLPIVSGASVAAWFVMLRPSAAK
jgi:hypothetical protein